MVEIKLEDVNKSINGNIIVNNVSLTIPDKSFYCILGPPGSGKTMLMRLIAGLDIPDKGRILFDGKDVTALEPLERGVAVVFQDFALYPHLTVFDNIASPLRVRKMKKDEIRKRVEEVTKYLKIDHRLTHYPAQLSGGEKQRVAIARAMIKDAQLILLDEPLVRLDYKIREDMRAELKRIQKELGRNVVLITSDPLDAIALGERIAIMLRGEIVQTGTMEEIYERPVNVFIGRYFAVTEMNTIEGKMKSEGEKTIIEAGPIKVEFPKINAPSEEVITGIRPEHISIVELSEKREVIFSGKLVLTEVIGSDTIIHLDVGFNEPLRVFIPEIYKRELRKEIVIGFDPKDLYIFSKKDKRLLFRGVDLLG